MDNGKVIRTAHFDFDNGVSLEAMLAALFDAGAGRERAVAVAASLGLEITVVPMTESEVKATVVSFSTRRPVSTTPVDWTTMMACEIVPEAARTNAVQVRQSLERAAQEVGGATVAQVLRDGQAETIAGIAALFTALHDLAVHSITSDSVPVPALGPETQGLQERVALELSKRLPVRITSSACIFSPAALACLSVRTDRELDEPAKLICGGIGASHVALACAPRARVIVTEVPVEGSEGLLTERLVLLETNIDDMNPQWYGHLMETLFDHGARDVTIAPVHMKKGRPGATLSVLATGNVAMRLQEILLRETTTFGVRWSAVRRDSLLRSLVKVRTSYGEISFKVGRLPDGSRKWSPEYDECVELARRTGVPVREVYTEALAEAETQLRNAEG